MKIYPSFVDLDKNQA